VILRGLTIDKKPLKDHMEAVGHKEAFDYVRELVKVLPSMAFELYVYSTTNSSLSLSTSPSVRGLLVSIPLTKSH